jgi:tol-pal system protein YbgF
MHRFFLVIALLLAAPALAQDAAPLTDRLQRLERDLNFLQKQVYRNAGGTSTDAPASGGAQTQAGFGQVQEQLREIRGEIEKLEFSNRKLADDYTRFKIEMDLRLKALEEKQAQLAVTAAAPAPVAAVPEPATAASESSFDPNAGDPAKEKSEKSEKAEKKPAATGKDFPNSNEHYNHAFRLLNAKNYSAAATSFDEFVKKYPGDPLVANAYYWLGESYYARNDYTRSQEAFRKGFEANPDGQKAPDNLYKLALSLSGVKRTNESCIVLQQIISKYGDSAPRIRDKAASERTTLQCK